MSLFRRFGLFAVPILLILAAVPAGRAASLETRQAAAAPQGPAGTAFTYQGQLNSAGAPVNASCDFQFSLWDDVAAGAQVGATLTPTLNVVNGLFTATLDFGSQFTGNERWLEIALQCPGDPDVTVLSPRVALLGVPYANGLRPGVAVADSSDGSSASIAITGYGLAGSNATGTGVHGSSASGAGVRGSSTTGPGVSGVSANDTGVLGEAQTSLQAGVKGTNSTDNGIGVRGDANATGGVGLWGQSSAGTGVFGVSTSGTGIHGSSAHSSGVYGTSGTTQQAGVKGMNEAGSGIGVRGEANSSGGVGVWGQSTANTGVYGLSTNGIGLWGQSTVGPAIRATSGGDGIHVINPGNDGVYVQNVPNNGVYVNNSSNNGVNVAFAVNNGVLVSSSAHNGIKASGNDYGGYFGGNIYVVGNCIGCLQANFAVNAGDRPLQPGDVVSVQTVTPADADSGQALWQVTPAQPGQTIAGVVAGRAERVAQGESSQAEASQVLVPRDGAAQPGEYVTIVYSGPMRVKTSASILVGEKLTIAAGGAVRGLRRIEVGGVPMAEDAPVLGIALSEPQDGRVWVLVNP